jgi:acetyltransferase-like isoleucine patch superfamily enzyme
MATYVIHPNVCIGSDHQIGEFVIIGAPTRNPESDGETHIGPGALIRSHTVIYAGNSIGANFQTGHSVLIRESNEIGDDVSIGSHSVIEHHLKIGNRVRIHSNVFIPEFSILDDDVWVGPNVVFTNAPYPMSPAAKATLKGPHLMTGAKIGANATLLPGVIIGRNVLIGAGSVVVRDVPEGKVVVGNPARVVRDINELPAYAIQQATSKGD